MNFIVPVLLFIGVLLIVEAGYHFLKNIWNPEKKLIRRRLNSIFLSRKGYETIDLSRNRPFSQIPSLNRIISRFVWSESILRLLEMANISLPLGVYILLSFIMAFFGYLMGSLFIFNPLLLLPEAILLGITPFAYIYYKKIKRMQKFQRQLPDALDLMARSLKAGHALTGGFKMVADEFDDPIGVEFEKTLNEINLGAGVPEALKNLSKRVDCLDLNFFVTSILIQRETGGNLAEILENIARLIRERFKLYGRIKVLSAEGKFSAIILLALPFLIAIVIYILNPNYIKTLVTDHVGPILIVIALILMVFGIFTMMKMINIKV